MSSLIPNIISKMKNLGMSVTFPNIINQIQTGSVYYRSQTDKRIYIREIRDFDGKWYALINRGIYKRDNLVFDIYNAPIAKDIVTYTDVDAKVITNNLVAVNTSIKDIISLTVDGIVITNYQVNNNLGEIYIPGVAALNQTVKISYTEEINDLVYKEVDINLSNWVDNADKESVLHSGIDFYVKATGAAAPALSQPIIDSLNPAISTFNPEEIDLICSIRFLSLPVPTDIIKMDIRQNSIKSKGAIKGEDQFRWGWGWYNGIPYQGNYVYVIYLPISIKDNIYKQLISEDPSISKANLLNRADIIVDEKIKKHVPVGSHYIINYKGTSSINLNEWY